MRKLLNKIPVSELREMVKEGNVPPLSELSPREIQALGYIQGSEKLIGDLKAVAKEYEGS